MSDVKTDISVVMSQIKFLPTSSRKNNPSFYYSSFTLARSETLILLQVIFANNQLHALFHVFIYFMSLRVSRITVLIIRRSNCINTSSGMISLCKRLLDMPVRTGILSSHLHRLIIPDDVLIQFDLLMMST